MYDRKPIQFKSKTIKVPKLTAAVPLAESTAHHRELKGDLLHLMEKGKNKEYTKERLLEEIFRDIYLKLK